MRSWVASLSLPRLLREFSRRGAVERRLVVEAAVIVPVVRVALSLLPFRTVMAIADRAAVAAPPANVAVERIAWAISTISLRVPRATCLTQALAAKFLLARHGHDSTVRLGVAKKSGELSAHAWLESGGKALIGETEPGNFVALVRDGNDAVPSSR